MELFGWYKVDLRVLVYNWRMQGAGDLEGSFAAEW